MSCVDILCPMTSPKQKPTLLVSVERGKYHTAEKKSLFGVISRKIFNHLANFRNSRLGFDSF